MPAILADQCKREKRGKVLAGGDEWDPGGAERGEARVWELRRARRGEKGTLRFFTHSQYCVHSAASPSGLGEGRSSQRGIEKPECPLFHLTDVLLAFRRRSPADSAAGSSAPPGSRSAPPAGAPWTLSELDSSHRWE